jgi:4-hydroxymandelate oxidase
MSTPSVDLADLWTLDEFEQLAIAGMRPAVRTMIQAGAGAGQCIARNRAAWGAWSINSRSLVDVSNCDLSVDVLGERHATPILLAPSGMHGLVHSDAEAATARAARNTNTLMILSMGTSIPIEPVAAVGARHWLQIYWGEDRASLRDLIQLAESCGFKALCLTTDMPARPWLLSEMRAALAELAAITPAYLQPRSAHIDSAREWDHDARLMWSDLAWLRSVTKLPIVLKGIMTPEDARLAAEHGVLAVVVSNHGGRALADAAATAEVLPEIADAVAGHLDILVDGGIRTGADVFKALALGARAVLIGRPVLWGLAVGGAAGVERVVELLVDELRSTCARAGCRAAAEIRRSALRERL